MEINNVPLKDFGKVAIATTPYKSVSDVFLGCWTQLLSTAMREGDRVLLPSGPNPVQWTRNTVAATFWRDTECDSLLWIDSDMAFGKDHVDRLRDNKANWAYDIVSGVAISRDKRALILRKTEPQWINDPAMCRVFGQWAYKPLQSPPTDGSTVSVDAMGMAFTLVRREVYEALADSELDATEAEVQQWYEFTGRIGEDVTFCTRAAQAGYRLGVDTGCTPGHLLTVAHVFSPEQGTGELATPEELRQPPGESNRSGKQDGS